jgi:hypothetical protein
MKLPGYAAEASLYKTRQVYRHGNAPTPSGSPRVVASDAYSDCVNQCGYSGCVNQCNTNLAEALIGCAVSAIFSFGLSTVGCIILAEARYAYCNSQCSFPPPPPGPPPCPPDAIQCQCPGYGPKCVHVPFNHSTGLYDPTLLPRSIARSYCCDILQ